MEQMYLLPQWSLCTKRKPDVATLIVFLNILHWMGFFTKFIRIFPILVLDLAELDELDNQSNWTWIMELTIHGLVKCSFAFPMKQFTIHG